MKLKNALVSLLLSLGALASNGCAIEDESEVGADDEEVGTAEQALGTFNLFPFADSVGARDIGLYGDSVYWAKGTEIWRTLKQPNGGSTRICNNCGSPWDLAPSFDAVYFTDATNGTIGSVSPNGGLPLLIATSPLPIIVEGNIVVDKWDVYWPASTAIYRASKAGGPATALVSGIAPVAITQDSSFVYFTGNALVRKVSKTTGAVTTLANGSSLHIALSGGRIYWSELGGVVRSVSTAGGPTTSFNTGLVGRGITSLSADNDYVFFTDRPNSGSGTSWVKRLSVANPSAAAVSLYPVSATLNMDDVSTDGTRIFWSDGNGVKTGDRF